MISAPTQRPLSALLRRLPRLALLVVAAIAMARTPYFFTVGTLGQVLALASIVGVLAVGQAFVLIGGGFDLSQGSTLTLSAVIAATLAAVLGWHPAIAAAIALVAGGGLGAINGVFVATVRTNPFVTTLSTMLIFRGAAFSILKGLPINRVAAFNLLDRGPTIAGTLLPGRAFVFVGLAMASAFVLKWTVLGRHLYAVGGNPQAARLSGLPVARLRILTFAISGATAALAALMLLSWVHTSKADTGSGKELDSIAACVVGGVSLQGGSGNVLGAAVGCLLLQALAMCFTMNGLPGEYTSLATGAVILTFAAADALARRSD